MTFSRDGIRRSLVVDELLEPWCFGDGHHVVDRDYGPVDVLGTELGRQHEALAQPVKAGFLHQLLRVLRVHHPDQFVADLELQVVIAPDVAEELPQFHFLQVDAQHLLQRRQRFVGHDVDAGGLAQVDEHGFERNVIQVNGYFLFQHLGHAAFGAFEVEQRAFFANGLAVGVRDLGRVLDPVHRVAHVFARRQTAVLVLGQQALDRGIKDRVLGVDLPDFVFQGLLAPLLADC